MIVSLGILATLGFTLMCAYTDAKHINKGEYIYNHISRWVMRFFFFLGIGLHNWIWFFASALLFTALFDQLLNHYRRRGFWYLGTVAYWDKFWNKCKWLYKLVKILCFIVSLFLFIFGI